MQSCFDRLLTWSDKNDMAVNFNKTKEMHGSTLPNIQPPTHPHLYTGHIERTHRHHAFQANPAIILRKTTIDIAVTTVL